MPKESTFNSIPTITLGEANHRAAVERTKKLMDKAALNEAILVISELEEEVAGMHISSRFNASIIPSESSIKTFSNPRRVGLSEQEYKRDELLTLLRGLKLEILSVITKLEMVVMDIEATKRDYTDTENTPE